MKATSAQTTVGLLLRCQRWIAAVSLLVVAFCGFSNPTWAAGPALALQDSTPVIQAWPAVSVMADPNKQLTLEQVLQMKAEFKPPQTAYGTLGLRKDAV